MVTYPYSTIHEEASLGTSNIISSEVSAVDYQGRAPT